MHLKKIIRKIHLILGLSSGLLILFLGITGCMLAFQREIENATQPYRFVTPQAKQFLPPSQLMATAAAKLPGKAVHSVLYQRNGKTAQVSFFQFIPERYYYIVYLDPYNGHVLKIKNMQRDFFYQVLQGHYYLWLPPAIGQPIIASATLIFVIMMVSGLILWWPKNRAARKQRFTIKLNARWRRKNYDLHYVLGFYVTWVAIIIALTGLVWGFQWFARAVYSGAGGKGNVVYREPASDTLTAASVLMAQGPAMERRIQEPSAPSMRQQDHEADKTYSGNGVYYRSWIYADVEAMDRIWEQMNAEFPAAPSLEVHHPTATASPIVVTINPDASTYWKADYRFFDRYSLKELKASSIYGRYKDAKAADKLIRMNYDIHTGGILGLPGKILMFFASLIAASLPVTGFFIWWGRRHSRLF